MNAWKLRRMNAWNRGCLVLGRVVVCCRGRCHRALGLGFLMLWLLAGVARGAEPRGPVPREVVDGLRKFAEKIKLRKSWRFEYRVDYQFSEAGAGGWPHIDVTNSRKGEWTLLHLATPKSDVTPKSEGPPKLEIAKSIDQFHLFKHGLALKRTDRLGVEISNRHDVYVFSLNTYLNTLGVDTFGDVPHQQVGGGVEGQRQYEISKALHWYPEALEQHSSKYSLLTQRETVDGSECLILEWPGMERVWVDAAHGYVIRKRQSQLVENGGPWREIQNLELEKVEDGFWLPRHQTGILYNAGSRVPPAERNKILTRWEVRMKKWEFDTLKDSDFDLEIPVGALVVDFVRQMTYQVQPETGDPLAMAITRAKGTVGDRSRKRWVLIAAIVVAAALLIDQARRYRRSRLS